MKKENPVDGYNAFSEITLPLQSDLRRYCLAKAGSAWDADDLFQETLVKAYRWHVRFPERELTKPFFFGLRPTLGWIFAASANCSHLPDNLMRKGSADMKNGPAGTFGRLLNCCRTGWSQSRSCSFC
ncbi:hypothetical protein EDM59_09745 [Brevibacillus nitrificans]|uniref:RNA polymerase sigma-70 region 2 domain-containing protein n=1 Tax=Brevibacillus nitrificans TaxID=651560 RepID=A0A3M8DHJ3_9BACL|nr:hypothetical protein EDM59_09745 [Brevibacillus nitrificans]